LTIVGYHIKVVTLCRSKSGYFVGQTMRSFRKSPQFKSALSFNAQDFSSGSKKMGHHLPQAAQ